VLNPLWWALLGTLRGGWFPVSSCCNLVESATQRLQPKSGGYIPNTGETAMRIHAEVPTKSKKLTTYVSLIAKFTLLDSNKHAIAKDLTFTQVKLLSENIPNSIIKFQAMINPEYSL